MGLLGRAAPVPRDQRRGSRSVSSCVKWGAQGPGASPRAGAAPPSGGQGGCERRKDILSDPQGSLGPSLQPVRVTEKDRTLMREEGETIVTGGLGGHIPRTVSEGWPGRPGMGRNEAAVTGEMG